MFPTVEENHQAPKETHHQLSFVMEAPDKPTDPNEVELTEVDKKTPPENNNEKRKELIINVKITFCTHVGWDGVLVMLFSLGIAGLFVYITFLYTKSFQAWHRPGVWVFMVFAVLYVVLVAKCLWTWKKMATAFTKEQQAEKDKGQGERTRSKSAIERVKQAAGNAKNIYEKLQVNGQWFLWKLYVSELFESAQQCINLVTVYLCSLPVGWTASICLGLAVDCIHTAWTMTHKNTPARRDRQVKIDTTVDFLCVAIPLCVMWFGYQVPISITEMLAISLMPTFSMLGKLDDILEEGIHHRAAQQVLKEQGRRSLTQKRRRESLFQQVAHLEMAKEQEDKVPRPVRFVAAGCKGLFGFFFLVVAIAHLAMRPTGCDETTWANGCVNKIPFCKSLFEPTCNCVSLKIENDYKLVALPNSLVDEMTGLRKVFIRNCNLTTLPPNMEQLTEMVDFKISFNRLEEFMVDVGKWEKLAILHLMYNNISKYNEKALWTHKNAAGVDIRDNVGLKVPDGNIEINMPSLQYIHLGNNSQNIQAVRFDSTSFPVLLYMYLNGNRLLSLPDESLKDTLLYLGMARCHLNSLPVYLSHFRSLKYLDVRDNNISNVDTRLKNLINDNKIESYFSGNNVCNRDTELDCKPLCSKYCWSRTESANGRCAATCNSGQCEYDGGDGLIEDASCT